MSNIMHILTSVWLAWCSIQDLKSKTIQMKSILTGSLMVLLSICFYKEVSFYSRLIACFIGIFFLGLSWISRENIGLGDGIIISIIALSYGYKKCISVLVLAFFLLFILTIVLLLFKKIRGKDRIPFVPFLLLGFIGSLL